MYLYHDTNNGTYTFTLRTLYIDQYFQSKDIDFTLSVGVEISFLLSVNVNTMSAVENFS